MNNFLFELHKRSARAILWNHKASIQYGTTTYAEAGIFIALWFVSSLIFCLFSGIILGTILFSALLVGEAFLTKYIFNIIKNGISH